MYGFRLWNTHKLYVHHDCHPDGTWDGFYPSFYGLRLKKCINLRKYLTFSLIFIVNEVCTLAVNLLYISGKHMKSQISLVLKTQNMLSFSEPVRPLTGSIKEDCVPVFTSSEGPINTYVLIYAHP